MTTKITTKEQKELLDEYTQNLQKHMKELLNIGVHPMMASIISGDLASVERVKHLLAKKVVDRDEAVWLVGSYGRMKFASEALTDKELTKRLPAIWQSSDFYYPHTSMSYLDLWKRAFVANGNNPLLEKPLKSRSKILEIYRGGFSHEAVSWTLNKGVAKFFSKRKGRVPTNEGKVFKGTVEASKVLGYITGRGEEEIIVDPANVIF